MSERHLREHRAEVGMVFQQFNLFPHMTVLDNLTGAPMSVRHLIRGSHDIADELFDRSACETDAASTRRDFQAASSNASRSHGHWRVARVDALRRADVRPRPRIVERSWRDGGTRS